MSFYRAILVVTLLFFASPVVAGDATSFDPTPIPVAAQAQAGVPVGTVIAWPKGSLPPSSSGVVPSQGACVAAVSTTQVESLGCEWLEADGSPISPAAYPELSAVVGGVLPDYRGEFLRGWDHGRGVDPGRTIGSHQADAVGPHRHSITLGTDEQDGGPKLRGAGTLATSGTGYTDLATGNPETRPRNVAVVYLIRAR